MLTKLCVLSLALLAGASAQTVLPYSAYPTTATTAAYGAYPATTAAYSAYPATTAAYSAYPTTAAYAAYPTTAAYSAYPTTAAYPYATQAAYPYAAYPYVAAPQAPVATTPTTPQYQQPITQHLTGPCQLYDTAASKASNPPVSGVIQYDRQQPYCDTFVASAVNCLVARSTLTQYAQNQCAAQSFPFAQ